MNNTLQNSPVNLQGLTSVEAKERLTTYGPNDIQARGEDFLKKYLAPLYSPISIMLLGAAFLSLFNGKDFDFYFILALYFFNYLIQKWQEHKADRAIEELQNRLNFDVDTYRDQNWSPLNAKMLVPGDLIRLGLGSIIPADARVISSVNATVNEAVLTGESMPKDKKANGQIFSGSFITTGKIEAEVTATGKNTSFGKTIFSIEGSTEKSILEQDILSISRFLTSISIAAVVILSLVFLSKGSDLKDILTLDLSLVIAGIPVALPAVMAFILSIGARELAKKMVIVRRLSALQDLSNVDVLLTDKTGTLTNNEIRIVGTVSYLDKMSTEDLLGLASLAASKETPNGIDEAIEKSLLSKKIPAKIAKILNFIPYDSERKRSTVFVENNGEKILISLGAAQVIESFCVFHSQELKEKFENDIRESAKHGFRVIALATGQSEKEEHLQMAGLFFLSDPLDETSKPAIRFMKEHGIDVRMLTGDNIVITEEIINELGLRGKVVNANTLHELLKAHNPASAYADIAAFAEILPSDKYEIVKIYEKEHVVAVTGDGINDLPALKAANVGIAVSGAVSALKSMADIVLLGRGVSVISDAIVESRKIFTRLYNYSVYRISESFRLIITILILGLIYGFYPLVPIQLILLAFLNDIPIISLATDRVALSPKPASINTRERFTLSLLFGSVGVVNSLLLFLLMTHFLHLGLPVIQTMFFLKLTVSGHMLVFVAHTKERWFKFLPSREVVFATIGTQLVATFLAFSGIFMPAKLSLTQIGFVWIWTLFWMQISELVKMIQISPKSEIVSSVS